MARSIPAAKPSRESFTIGEEEDIESDQDSSAWQEEELLEEEDDLHQEQNEMSFSSSSHTSSDFDSSSSGSTTVSPLQNQTFAEGAMVGKNNYNVNGNSGEHRLKRNETGSVKLRRIFSGSSSSSSDDEYISTGSSNSNSNVSDEFEYEEVIGDEESYFSIDADMDRLSTVEESANFSMDSRSRSSEMQQLSISEDSRPSNSPSNTHQESTPKIRKDESLIKPNGTSTTRAPKDPPTTDSTDGDSSAYKVERLNETRNRLNNVECDEAWKPPDGWKPPALTTFCPSSVHRSTKEHQLKKEEYLRDYKFESNQGSWSTPRNEKILKKMQPANNKMPRPLSEITENAPLDNSTLGAEGTYFQRAQIINENKDNERTLFNGSILNPKIPNTTRVTDESGGDTEITKALNACDSPHDINELVASVEQAFWVMSNDSNVPVKVAGKTSKVIENQVPAESGGDTEITKALNARDSPHDINELVESVEQAFWVMSNDSNVPVKVAGKTSKFPETVENSLSHEQKGTLQRMSGLSNLGSNYRYFSDDLIPRNQDGHESGIRGRVDPPGDSYLYTYDPRNLQLQQMLPGSSDPTDIRGFDDDNEGSALPKAIADIQGCVTTTTSTPKDYPSSSIPLASWGNSPSTPQNLPSSSIPLASWGNSPRTPKKLPSSSILLASWVPSIMKSQGNIGTDPTKIFINSLMNQKRSTVTPKSIQDRHMQQRPQTQISSQMSDGFDDSEVSGRTGSEDTGSRSYSVRELDISESTSESTKNLIEMERSESSTSRSQGINVDRKFVLGNERKGNPRVRRASITPMPQLLAISDTSSIDDDALVLQVEEQRLENKSDFSAPREEKRKMTTILLFSLVVLILGGAIVVVVLWQLKILFNPDGDESQSTPNTLPTPKPMLPVMPPTTAPSNAITMTPSSPLITTPSSAPSEIDRGIDLLGLITEAYPKGRLALQNPNSPQTKALEWLESSGSSGASSVQKILQRYVLATVYYATNGDNWIDGTGWLSEGDECNWMSKTQFPCNEKGEFTKLDLKENNLSGTLPAELEILSGTLQSIDIRDNYVSGEISWGLVNLEELDLSSNNFSGDLTRDLFDATKLTRLSLFDNKLSSSIPTELGQLTNLDMLDLGSNTLTSTIPTTIGKLSALTGLSLFNNLLTGTIPAELSNIKGLKNLYTDSNYFKAPLPTGVCLLDVDEFWGDCEEIQCICCTTCCSDNFGCYVI